MKTAQHTSVQINVNKMQQQVTQALHESVKALSNISGKKVTIVNGESPEGFVQDYEVFQVVYTTEDGIRTKNVFRAAGKIYAKEVLWFITAYNSEMQQ